MAWDERQRALLAEMGIRVWPARATTAAAPGRAADAAAVVPRPSTVAAVDGGVLHAGVAAVPVPTQTAEPVAVRDAADWATLGAAARACTACGLHATRDRAVFGNGTAPAHWLIVGDPPGEGDERDGLPATGREGLLLGQMLRALGVRLDAADAPGRAVVTPVVKCRPPLGRAPLPAELAACDAVLLRQIALLQPRVVLAVGRFAVQSVLQTELPIGRLRGQVHRPQRLGGVPVIATFALAYLLRNPADKARAWDDLCLAHGVATAAP